jgi:hypothetical protein
MVRAGFNSDSKNGKVRMLYRSENDANFKTVYNEADASFTGTLPSPRMFRTMPMSSAARMVMTSSTA